MNRRRCSWLVLASALVLLPVGAVAMALDARVESALLQADWAEVRATLERDNGQAADPVARLVMAHACLATNRNNAALLLFLSVSEEDAIKRWAAWTDTFLARHPGHRVALYLAADAQARSGRFPEAVQRFNEALTRYPDFALGYTARGVLRLLTGERDLALLDLQEAVRQAPNLAEAHANLGVFHVLHEAPQGAIDAFNDALARNPEFALAYNGRGIGYFGQGRFDAAASDFATAAKLVPLLAVAEVNQGLATAYAAKLLATAPRVGQPGMTLQMLISEAPERRREVVNRLSHGLPGREDSRFWTAIERLPDLTAAERKALDGQYGPEKVQTAGLLKQFQLYEAVERNNSIVQQLQRQIGGQNRWIIALYAGETALTLGTAAAGTVGEFARGEATRELAAGLRVYKAVASQFADRGWSVLQTAMPVYPTLEGFAVSLTAATLKVRRYQLEDERRQTLWQQAQIVGQTVTIGQRIREYSSALRTSPDPSLSTGPSRSGTYIPGYYTDVTRPLTEVGAMASMVDNSISAAPGRTRTALIVGEDSLRTTLLQTELGKYGFRTQVVPPTVDAQRVGQQAGADVILGIKSASRLPALDMRSREPTPKPIEGEITRRPTFPPFPPGGGGGGAAVPSFDWGKPFVPTPTRPQPGGVSTEQLAQAFVDKGDWPVRTPFGLLYLGTASAIETR